MAVLLLSGSGGVRVYSGGQTDIPSAATHACTARIRGGILSSVLAYAVSRALGRFFEWAAFPRYIASCILLLFLLKVGGGAGDAASSKSWLVLARHRPGQPAEHAKAAVILRLARELGARREAPRTLPELGDPALAAGTPWTTLTLHPAPPSR